MTGFSVEALWNGDMTIVLVGKEVAASGVTAAKLACTPLHSTLRTRVSPGEQACAFCKLFFIALLPKVHKFPVNLYD
jgi:hypothetical protein